MTIKHNSYLDGKAQSLGFKDAAGQDVTVGVLEPGEYDFGIAERTETVSLITGNLVLADEIAGFVKRIPNGFVFERGTPVVFRCGQPTSYLCRYS